MGNSFKGPRWSTGYPQASARQHLAGLSLTALLPLAIAGFIAAAQHFGF